MSASDEVVFIPCEICDVPVALDDYAAHTDACNSARFISFHGISLSEILNPLQQNHQPQSDRQDERGSEYSGESERDEDEPEPVPSNSHPVLADFAPNLASEGEEESPDEIDYDEAGRQLLFRVLFNGRNIDRGVNLIPNPANPVIQGEPPSIDELVARIQNLMAADANLEDVAVGLTPEQRDYCLTNKRISKPTDTKDELGTCNICCEDNLDEMTTLICGHDMCPPCATKHFTANVKCPFCNQDLRDMMNPNA